MNYKEWSKRMDDLQKRRRDPILFLLNKFVALAICGFFLTAGGYLFIKLFNIILKVRYE
jgi:hypothetical protein